MTLKIIQGTVSNKSIGDEYHSTSLYVLWRTCTAHVGKKHVRSTVANVALSVRCPHRLLLSITTRELFVIINVNQEHPARRAVGLRSKRFGQSGPDGRLTPDSESGEMTPSHSGGSWLSVFFCFFFVQDKYWTRLVHLVPHSKWGAFPAI